MNNDFNEKIPEPQFIWEYGTDTTPEDITAEIMQQKQKKRLPPIDDADLSKAAEHALIEANRWVEAAEALEKNSMHFDIQISVLSLFSIELYLKSVLMFRGNNITNHGNRMGHCLIDLYRALSPADQQALQDGIKPSGKSRVDLDMNYVILDTFEKELEFNSNDFIGLRYNYERFLNNQTIIISGGFVEALRANAKKLAYAVFQETLPNNTGE